MTDHDMRSTRDITTRALKAYLILLATFFVLVVATGAIPAGAIRGNLDASVQLIASEGAYPSHGPSITMQDNFTDCVMLNIAAGADASRPVASAMTSTLHIAPDGDIIAGTRALLDGRQVDARPYARYWHGSQALLRPLLCIMDYRGIRVLNYILLSLLALACILLSIMRLSPSFALNFAVGLVMVAAWLVPLNMQYVACFGVMLVAMLVLLAMPGRLHSMGSACVTFFVIGGVTQFLDLLTTPVITLGLPLIVWYMLHKPARGCRVVVMLSLMWGLGYASLWASKWVLASLITGTDVIGDAMASVKLRSVGGETAEQGLTWAAICKIYWTWIASRGKLVLAALVAAVLAITVAYRRWGRPRRIIAANSWLLLVAAIPVAWTLVLAQHTFLHHFFTWRIVLVTIVALLLFVCHTLSFKKTI